MRSVAESIVKAISEELVQSYVFLEVAQQCVDHMTVQCKSGAYDVDDVNELAARLTTDLQAVSHDKHLRVRRRAEKQGNLGLSRDKAEQGNYGFRKVEVLDDNVGYIDFHYFAPVAWAAETVVATMRFVANTKALVFDLRRNGGGDPGLVAWMSSYLFKERTLLNTLYWRAEDFTDQYWTAPYVPGPLYLDKPVYLLTSSSTFSGAEEFAYNLKNLNRARIVGEVTGGGAHPGETSRLPAELEIFVPKGRAINPITRDNWEGTGVVPHTKTSAEDALNVALSEINDSPFRSL